MSALGELSGELGQFELEALCFLDLSAELKSGGKTECAKGSARQMSTTAFYVSLSVFLYFFDDALKHSLGCYRWRCNNES